MTRTLIQTLVVEDDPILAEAHRTFTARVPGFAVAGVAYLGADALRQLATCPVDVLLLDVNLPDMSGIELCRTLRARGNDVDVIAVTSARDLSTVRSARRRHNSSRRPMSTGRSPRFTSALRTGCRKGSPRRRSAS